MVSLTDIQSFFHGRIALSEPLAKYVSLEVGGPADYVLEASSQEELEELVKYFRKNEFPFHIVQPNTLVGEKGFRGAAIILRNNAQQISMKRCATMFASPGETSAAELIERAGLNGLLLGGAEVVGNCILNVNNATADELYTLVRHVKNIITAQFGISLQLELQVIGFDQQTLARVA